MRVLRVCSVPLALLGYRSHLREIVRHGIDLTIATTEDDKFSYLKNEKFYKLKNVEINRDINIKSDVKSVINLYREITNLKPQIVHSNTPKGGIICTLASFMARTPVRVHTFTGQRWITLGGFKKQLLKIIDNIIIALNTHVLADSPSQADFLNKEFKTNKVRCLGLGSFGGVDLEKFDYKKYDKLKIRKEMNFSESDFIVLYLGRISRDKGIEDLLNAFLTIERSNFKLLLVGPYEMELDGVSEQSEKIMLYHPRIFRFDFTNEPEKYFSACDLFCLPSYREGFGTVILEAAAMKRPTVGTNIYGISDAIVDGETGLLCKVKSPDDLKNKIEYFINNRDKLELMGEAAYKRVVDKFDYKVVTKNLINFYRKCLSEKNL